MSKKIFLFLSCIAIFHAKLMPNNNAPSNIIPNSLAIIIDTSEYETKYLGATTRNLFCLVADAAYPIMVSKHIAHNAIRLFSKHQTEFTQGTFTSAEFIKFIADHFITKDAGDFYLLIPGSTENIPGLRTKELKTISLQNEVDKDFAQWLSTYPSGQAPNSTINSIKNIFISDTSAEKSSSFVWNIYLEGHGDTTGEIVGLPGNQFATLLTFFKKSVPVKLIYLESCFTLGQKTEVFAYMPWGLDWWNAARIVENYPFTIIAASTGETFNYAAIEPTKFPNICKNNLSGLFKALTADPSQDYYEIFKKAGFIRTLEAGSILQIRPKNTEMFIPLVSKIDKSLINISQVIGKTNRKEPLEVTYVTKLILVAPEVVQFPIVFTGNFSMAYHTRIISMTKGAAQHTFEKIEFKNKPDDKLNQFDFLCALFAPRFAVFAPQKYSIKEVTFSNPFTYQKYKNIEKLTNVIVEVSPNEASTAAPYGINNVKMLYTVTDKDGKQHFLQETYSYIPYGWKDPIKGSKNDFERMAENVLLIELPEPYKY